MKTMKESIISGLLGIFAGITVIALGFTREMYESYVICLSIITIYYIIKKRLTK